MIQLVGLAAPCTIMVESCNAENTEKRQKKLTHNSKILSKVQDVLESDDVIKAIMDQYKKQNETKEEYNVNRENKTWSSVSNSSAK